MNKNLFFAISLFLFFISISSYSQKDVTVPETSSFDSGMGSESSVNQSNGKLNIGLNLVSLKGYKDLTASFGIAYDGNNVTRNAKASNEIIPTGVLGLGWGMSFSRIMADNKLTAARDDDKFYLFEGGLIELIGIEKTATRYSFQLKQHKPWKVYFYPNQEKWEVIKENGYKYTYSNVDWAVYWENWIGNSNQPNAQRQGASWNLTSVEDLYGNKVEYEYINVDQSLKNTGAIKHTEATYLSKIIGPCGEEIRLVYEDKLSIEYYEPNTNQQEPDAYQENYETKYLRWVEAYDTTQQLMYKYRLDYDYLITGNGEFRKRLLKEITLINANNESQFFRSFDYDTNQNSEFYGNLLHQILPTRGRISYDYHINEIPVDQITDITTSSSANFISYGNYVLKLGGGNKVYTWNGSSWEIQTLSVGLTDVQLVYRNNFFVVLWREGNTYYSKSYALKNDGYTWQESSKVTHTIVDTDDPPRLIAGDDFYAIGYSRKDRVYMYKWNGSVWQQHYRTEDTPGRYFYTGTNNYVLQNKRGLLDYVSLHYFDITNTVQTSQFDIGIGTSGSACANNADTCPDNYWSAQNSFAQVNAQGNSEYLITWDKDYSFFNKTAPFGQIADHSPVFGIGNTSFATFEDATDKVHMSRYIGNNTWKYNNFSILINPSNPANSHAAVLKNDFIGNRGFGTFNVLNANTLNWQNSNENVSLGQGSEVIGKNYVIYKSKIFEYDQSLSLNELSNINLGDVRDLRTDGGNSFYYRDLNTSQKKIISLTSENKFKEYILPNNYSHFGNFDDRLPVHGTWDGTFIFRRVGNNSEVSIYKLINNEIIYDNQGNTVYKDIVVARETYDPVLTRKQYNYYCYSNPKITSDNSRVHYSQVVMQNDLNGVLGKTVTFYDAGTDDGRKTGLPNKIQVYDSDSNLVSEEINKWAVNELGLSYHITLSQKLSRSIESGAEMTNEQNYTYNYTTGQLRKTVSKDSEGNYEISATTYLYEIYPQLAEDYNLISPVVYTRSYSSSDNPSNTNDAIVKSATAVKWNTTATPPHPKLSYQWNGKGGYSGSTYDFNGTNPNFRLSQHLTKYDALGNLIEERNLSNVTTSYIYGYNSKRLVAKVEGASHNQAIALINTSIINNPSSDTQMRTELQKIRDGLPDAFVTTYTYEPSVGVTSLTDARGRTQTYYYDNFYRLDHLKDHEGTIVNKTTYQYRDTPFTYTEELTAINLPDCDLINQEINNDPSNLDPLTLAVEFVGTPSQQGVTFRAVASDGGMYDIEWVYSFSDPAEEQYFDISENGNTLSISRIICGSDTMVTVSGKINGINPQTGQPENITSNSLSHTFVDTGADPSLDCFEN